MKTGAIVEVPEDVWSKAVSDACDIVRGFRVPMNRQVFRPVICGLIIANLSVALDRRPEDFGGYVLADRNTPNTYMIRDVRLRPVGHDGVA